MDKLQPLIKHRYWICFGLATIFVLTAWFLASGQLAAEIDARTASVKGSFDKSGQGKDQPNQKWVEEAKKRNEVDANAYKNAAKSLRERQISARQWPELIREEMKGIAYQEQIQNQLTREKWAANYKDEVESLLEIVTPWRDGKGLVVVDSNRITHRPYNAWRTKNPQSREIWDAQEDIWLLRALLTSIATANGTAERITESAVREIYRLHLRGGDRSAAGASSGGGMGGMGGGMGGMSGAMSGESGGGMSPMSAGAGGGGGMGAMGEGGMGGGVSTSHPGSSFVGSAGSDILAEEFGAVAGAGGGMGGMGGEGGKGGGPGMMSMGSMGAGAMSSGGGMPGGGAAAAPAEEDRYVDEVPESYKTRAFLLDVLVRDDRVPDLLAALTDSDFPVEIVRVEISAVGSGSAAAGGMSGLGGEGGLGEMSGLGGMSGMGSMPDLGGYPGGGGSKGLTGPPSGGGLGSPGLGLSGGGAMGGPGSGQFGEDEGSGLAGGFPGGASFGTQNQKDAETLRIAMSDDSLVTLRIGGLMTLYQSAEEAKSAEETEAAAATETTTAAPPANTTPADPAATPEGSAPAANPANPSNPADPADPAAPQPTDPSSTAPPADPNAPPAPAATDSSGNPSAPPADSPATPANSEPPAGDSSPAADPGTAPNPPAGAPGQ